MRRPAAALLLVVVVGAGLSVHAFLPDNDATDIAGDALYAAAAYLMVVSIGPNLRPAMSGCLAAAWCVGVELFQLTGIPLELGAAFPPAMLVLGTVFDARDLLVYVATIAGITGGDAVLTLLRDRRAAA